MKPHKLVIEIKMDNAAFDDASSEVSRILSELADDIRDGGMDQCLDSGKKIMDVNGNTVGFCRVKG